MGQRLQETKALALPPSAGWPAILPSPQKLGGLGVRLQDPLRQVWLCPQQVLVYTDFDLIRLKLPNLILRN